MPKLINKNLLYIESYCGDGNGVIEQEPLDAFTSVVYRLAGEQKHREIPRMYFDGFKSRCGHVQGEIRGVFCFYDSRPTFYCLASSHTEDPICVCVLQKAG